MAQPFGINSKCTIFSKFHQTHDFLAKIDLVLKLTVPLALFWTHCLSLFCWTSQTHFLSDVTMCFQKGSSNGLPSNWWQISTDLLVSALMSLYGFWHGFLNKIKLHQMSVNCWFANFKLNSQFPSAWWNVCNCSFTLGNTNLFCSFPGWNTLLPAVMNQNLQPYFINCHLE